LVILGILEIVILHAVGLCYRAGGCGQGGYQRRESASTLHGGKDCETDET
jgi:hypothetical protein